MGLKNRSIHMMLANPHMAPFDLVPRPQSTQDWVLIDHLMIVFKVKANDYVEGDSKVSILNMANTLASHYKWEESGSHCVILVKDGPGAHKPAVTNARNNKDHPPHIQFCIDHLPKIEYVTMKLLSDMGMKNKLFLVTGAIYGHDKTASPADIEIAVALHSEHDHELSDVDPEYLEGTVTRPDGVSGVFIASFADPSSDRLALLRNACLQCNNTEADMLMIELGNLLNGTVMVCSGDSDLVGVLTACNRNDITVRLNNHSYTPSRQMHRSAFGELLCEVPQKRNLSFSDSKFSCRLSRCATLYDIGNHKGLADNLQCDHDKWEECICKRFPEDPRMVACIARYLCLGGVRGSVYRTFLSMVTSMAVEDINSVLDCIAEAVQRDQNHAKVWSIIECAASTLAETSTDVVPRNTEKKRKRSLSDEGSCSANVDANDHTANYQEEVEKEEEEGEEEEEEEKKKKKKNSDWVLENLGKDQMASLNKLRKLYMIGMVPLHSYERYLSLTHSGRYFYMRLSNKVSSDNNARILYTIFMILCGTDYNCTFPGLGAMSLMRAMTHKDFPLWCQKLERLWQSLSEGESSDFLPLAKELALMSEISNAKMVKWTGTYCALCIKTMKYAYDLWTLKCPVASETYGFLVDGTTLRYVDM